MCKWFWGQDIGQEAAWHRPNRLGLVSQEVRPRWGDQTGVVGLSGSVHMLLSVCPLRSRLRSLRSLSKHTMGVHRQAPQGNHVGQKGTNYGDHERDGCTRGGVHAGGGRASVRHPPHQSSF